MIKSRKLSKQQKINHGFFNRVGGKSTGIYKSLNCGNGSNDKQKNIKNNLRIVKNKISKNSKNIFLVNQVHSNKFIYVNRDYIFKKKRLKLMLLLQIKKNFR